MDYAADAAFDRNAQDCRKSIGSELRSIIAQVEASMRLIETSIAQESESILAGSADVVVLDDLTPRYTSIIAALFTCKSSLDLALRSLTDAGRPEPGAGAEGATSRLPDLVA